MNTTVDALLEDEQFSNTLAQAVAMVSTLSRRAYDMGTTLSAESLANMIARHVSNLGADELAAVKAQAVVSLAEVRAAKGPHVVRLNQVTASFSAETADELDALAVRAHGEANTATRSLVMQAAIERGLQALVEGQ